MEGGTPYLRPSATTFPASQSSSAAIALLDRGWGKPQQAIEMDWRQKPADKMTDEELMAIARGGAIDA